MRRDKYIETRIYKRIKVLQRALQKGGIKLKLFRRGNGIKTISDKVGRVDDFSGVYVIQDENNENIIVKYAKHVFRDIQQVVRGKRNMDRELLENVASRYGFRSSLAGKTYLKDMKVWWIEEPNEKLGRMLARTFKRQFNKNEYSNSTYPLGSHNRYVTITALADKQFHI